MASPAANAWMSAPGQQLPGIPASEAEEMGLQVRPMGLKVHYTFDKEGRVNCLARWPQTLQVQAIPLDEANWIGVTDLRTCLQAIAHCSPEIISQTEHDYTIYAYDYSEPDTPLVGQGMLSWALDLASSASPTPPDDGPKMVTGRVTKNVLAIFGNGLRETLEVKLKLTEVHRSLRPETTAGGDASQPKNAPTPTDTTEWNSFLQANPTLGRSASVSAVQSPALAPVRPDTAHFQPRPMSAASRPGSRPASRQSSMPPSLLPKSAHPLLAPKPAAGSPPPLPMALDEPARTSTPPAEPVQLREPAPRPSRPSSRARSRVPTGRPRGRPRKRQPVDGNTSAAEELPTDPDPDDGSKRKRVKTTKADYPSKTLDMPPDSLRVAASTSGSLRQLRPIMSAPMPGSDSHNGPSCTSHLQEMPRAPTPVPQGVPPSQHHVRKMMAQKSRRESLADFDRSAFPDQDHLFTRSADARSPTESIAPSPENYTPEDSPADIGSSPPVPRSTTYVPQSSPMPSSPILPPMPRPQPDSGFMSGGMEDMFDEDECLNDLNTQPPACTPKEFAAPTPAPFPSETPMSAQPASHPTSQRPLAQRRNSSRPVEQYSFMHMNPGPPELLPVTSIYNPPPPPKPKPVKGQKAGGNGRSTPASLQRSYSEPAHLPQQLQQPLPQHPHPLNDHTANALPAGPASQAGSAAPTPAPTPAGTTLPEPTLPTAAETQDARIGDEMVDLARLISAENEREHSAQPSTTPMDDLQHVQPPFALPLPEHLPSDIFPSSMNGDLSVHSMTSVVPASDPAVLHPLALPAMPPAPTAFSEAVCPPSDNDQPRSNKNLVRKAAIRERLQKAIESGEMPPFCQNCGAIETPTWRKMWTQDHDGEPGYHEYSEKPGHVTAIDVLERNEEGKPTKHRLVKKALGPTEDSKQWTQMLLCNPCGIWLGKFKSHRPSDRWDRDASRLNQPRRKRDSKSGGSRSKKPRTKSDPQMQLTSEAYFTTDPAGPPDVEEVVGLAIVQEPSTLPGPTATTLTTAPATTATTAAPAAAGTSAAAQGEQGQHQSGFEAGSNREPVSGGANQQGLRSSHSRGSGTAKSPIAIEDNAFGSTRRLLFPSPRKDGVPKVLGELDGNSVVTAPAKVSMSKLASGEDAGDAGEYSSSRKAKDDMVDLFGTPPPSSTTRPSTPPPRSDSSVPGLSGPFKTPTRPTPSHRPMTRSITKSIRSVVHYPKSPSEGLMAVQRTPSKTPRSAHTSSSKRRAVAATVTATITTPGRQSLHAPFQVGDMTFDTPFTSTLNQLLSEANDFTTGSPSHGLADFDLTSLASMDHDGINAGFHAAAVNIDFSSYLDTDLVMPSSSPLLGRKAGGGHGSNSSSKQHQVTFGETLTVDSDALWTDFSGAVFPDDAMDGHA